MVGSITINYRLGPLGFIRLADVTNGKIPATGNEGILESSRGAPVGARQYAEFGGDPGNVTIFGESAAGRERRNYPGDAICARPVPAKQYQSGASHTGVRSRARIARQREYR